MSVHRTQVCFLRCEASPVRSEPLLWRSRMLKLQTLLLEEYFLEGLAQIIKCATYIKPEVKFDTWRKVAIDSTGNIWEGMTPNPLKKLHNTQRVQSFSSNSINFITLEGSLAYLNNRQFEVDTQILDIDIIPTNSTGPGFYYITPTGKLCLGNSPPIILSESIVQIVWNVYVAYLLTVTGRTLVYDLRELVVIAASRTSSLANVFTDDTTDTTKLCIAPLLNSCYQLKLDGTLRVINHNGGLKPYTFPAPKELDKIVDLRADDNTLVILGSTGLLAVSSNTYDFIIEKMLRCPASFDVYDDILTMVTKDGRIMYRGIAITDYYTTVPRIRLL